MPDDAFSLRLARRDDLPLLSQLEIRAALRFRDSVHPYCADLPPFDAAQLAALAGAGTVWVAARADDAPVGFAIAERWGDEAYLHELDVEQASGRRGLGRRLVRRVAEWARDAGLPTLLLSTFSDVPWNAPFYARLGFVVVPLADYDEALRARRESDGRAGLLLASRVIMRAPVQRLLE